MNIWWNIWIKVLPMWVVLGTAGGLITSNIVKKNQIEDGFEDIQCTVGGQVISNWGDEFRVGIQ